MADYTDPLPGAKAVLKSTEGLAKVAADYREARATTDAIQGKAPAAAPAMAKKVSRPEVQPKGMRGNVGLRRSMTGGRR